MTTAVAAPSPDYEAMLAAVDQMTMVEFLGFIKRVEERFDVVAQPAPMVIDMTQRALEDDAPVVEQTEFKVVLANAGQARVNVIKVVNAVTGLGLKGAKDIVDAAPATVKDELSKQQAEEIVALLHEAGATASVE